MTKTVIMTMAITMNMMVMGLAAMTMMVMMMMLRKTDMIMIMVTTVVSKMVMPMIPGHVHHCRGHHMFVNEHQTGCVITTTLQRVSNRSIPSNQVAGETRTFRTGSLQLQQNLETSHNHLVQNPP